MTTTDELDLERVTAVPLDGGSLSVHGCEVALATPSGDTLTRYLPGLDRSFHAAYWTDGDRLLMVGLRDRSVVLADPSGRFLGPIGELDRLDLSGSYDPGGLEHVSFVDVSAQRVAIVFELGIAMVDLAARSTVWQGIHDDAAAVFREIAAGVAWFDGDSGRFGVRLTDGAFQVGSME